MKFIDFIEKGQVRRSSVDMQLVKALLNNSKKDLLYLES